MYRPVGLADLPSIVTVSVRTHGVPPAGFGSRVREIAAAVDPRLQLHELRVAADVERTNRQTLSFLALGIAAVTLSVLLLSAAGIYAMMSFTVARRRREIGIRSALGANPRRLLAGIFGRAAGQLGGGIVAGLLLATVVARIAGSNLLGDGGPALLLAVVALMSAIGLLATLGPARSGLTVQPTEALREE
jgi:putative ABC transport system permease protein